MKRLLPLLALACTSKEPEKVLPALRYQPATEESSIASAQFELRKAPHQPDVWERLAAAFIQRSRETADPQHEILAGELIAEARARFPGDARIERLAIMALQTEHRFREARDRAAAMTERSPEDTTALLLLGDAHLELGEYREAASAYQRALDLRPDIRSYNRGAYLRWLHGDFDGALELLDMALESGSPRDPEPRAWCYVDVARMYLHRGDAARAEKALDLALALVPSYAPALSLKARARALEGDTGAALELLRGVLTRKPEASDLILLSELETGQAAAAALERAHRLAHHDPRPLALYLARHRLQPDKALELATRARTDRPTVEAEDAYALAALRAGKLDEAMAAAERATSLGTLDAEIWLHRALIEAARGSASAARSYARALELNPKVDPILRSELESAKNTKAPEPRSIPGP